MFDDLLVKYSNHVYRLHMFFSIQYSDSEIVFRINNV